MDSYTIAEFTFVCDSDGSVDVLFGENSVGHFTIPPGAGRVEFIQECEDYFSREMVYA